MEPNRHLSSESYTVPRKKKLHEIPEDEFPYIYSYLVVVRYATENPQKDCQGAGN